jgi:hypothetical protein
MLLDRRRPVLSQGKAMRNHRSHTTDRDFTRITGSHFPAVTTFFVMLGALDVASLVAWAINM